MRSIVASIYRHSIETPKKTAIIAQDYTADYALLWQWISGTAYYLSKAGVQQGDRIILEAGHTVEYLVCCYGIHLLGAVHVPVENNVPVERIRQIADEMSPKLVLTGRHPLEKLDVSLEQLMNENHGVEKFPEEDWLQEILFTTGTTGKSKGVMITHYAQMNMCEAQNAVLNYSTDNVWMIPTPMNHAAGLRKTHMSMVKGSTVLLINGFKNLKLFFDSMREYHVTSLYLPPSAVHYILVLAGEKLAEFDEQLDFLYSSSSALPNGDKEKLIKLLPHVRKFDAYGGSEVGAVCYIDYNALRDKVGCVGKANQGVDIFIVDENYAPIDTATKENPGIIAIRSNTVTAGYWNEPELTAETIKDGVIYMTDLGYIKDGYLFLVGRRDDVINIGGLKVAPTEVEDITMQFDKVNECVCMPYDVPNIGKCIKMFVVMKKGCNLDVEKLVTYLETKLEAYKIPKVIEEIDEIPKTFNGKIDRRKLRATMLGTEK